MKKVCCFAGHGKIYNTEEILLSLINQIENLITNENVTEFLVGNYGDFDTLCAKAVRIQKEYRPHIKLLLTLPYLTAEINNNKDYYENLFDEIIVATIPEKTPCNLKIIKCNEYMVDNSAFIICHVKNHCTGADKTLQYAKRKKRHIIHI